MIEFALERFVATIADRLDETEMSARALAKRAGVAPSTLTRLADGTEPTMATFLALCNAVNADPADYFRLKQKARSSTTEET